MKKIQTLLLAVLISSLLAACVNQPTDVKSESVKPEPVKPEPVKPEPVKPEPVKPEPVKPEPVIPEPVIPEPVKPEPVKPEPVKPEPVKPEPVKPEPVIPEPVKPEPVKPEPVKPEPVKPEPVKPVSSAYLSGNITLDQSKLSRQNAEVSNTIVYFEPNDTNTVQNIAPTNKVISTQNKRFVPSVLAVTAGSEISFPNMDRILHNVFSVSPLSEFDLGLYSAGTTKSVKFDEPGIIYVHCNVHHSMQADILVLNTPYFTQVDSNGHFTLNDLPNTAGTLKIWHPRGNITSLVLDQQNNIDNINQTLVITRPKVPKHSNKFGQSYRPTRD